MPSSLISRRGLAASSMCSSATRSILAGSSSPARVLTSNSTGDGSSVNVDLDMLGPFVREMVGGAAGSAPAGAERGDGVGGDVVERLRGVGDHGDAVALDRQRRDPDREVDRRDAELGEPPDPLDSGSGVAPSRRRRARRRTGGGAGWSSRAGLRRARSRRRRTRCRRRCGSRARVAAGGGRRRAARRRCRTGRWRSGRRSGAGRR